ncbi:hypothetical protein FA10DRAFT_73288 [Acaromyces ingoldii]|uniref:Uncharacterized protein n=1 Tax=Acaromyces ingoldii TaxID=215250 RepID=A0A316YRS0_9BASI|nr:hypothetical protein FA10DRAFT_73288 [Acaromyces ingoldii]PWN91706.1 hypothetical protein FA10DRAFT_73288 [Acaromyces ingoldii]
MAADFLRGGQGHLVQLRPLMMMSRSRNTCRAPERSCSDSRETKSQDRCLGNGASLHSLSFDPPLDERASDHHGERFYRSFQHHRRSGLAFFLCQYVNAHEVTARHSLTLGDT